MTTPAPRASTRKTAAPPTGSTTTGAQAQANTTQKSMQQHLVTVAECEVMDPQGLYTFLESLRALTSGLAFFSHAASSQLEAAARKGAKNSNDGRMTLKQKMDLQRVLRRMGRELDNRIAEDLLAAATGSVKTYALMEAFLDELESAQTQRPHRSSKGGFNPFGSN